jgi:hypothetical protein
MLFEGFGDGAVESGGGMQKSVTVTKGEAGGLEVAEFGCARRR